VWDWELGVIVVLAATTIAARWVDWRQQKASARRLFDQHKAIYQSEPYEYRVVDAAEFPDLDHSFYDACWSWFEANGFRFLADRENVTLSQLFPAQRTFIRTVVSGDGSILGLAHHIQTATRGFLRDIKTVGFETELSDGTFVTTSNTSEAARTLPIPGIDSLRCPQATPIAELLRIHRERLANSMRSKPFLSATCIRTMENCIHFQHRMQAVSSKHKQSTGYIGAADLEQNCGRQLTARERGIARELERLKRAEREEESGWSEI
jgi:hypothetical protein